MATKFRTWAFWRRFWYGTGFGGFWLIVVMLVVLSIGTTPPTCFDGEQNGDERGVDCGGVCVRLCQGDATPPIIEWAESFEIVPGQYNAVAYVNNPNRQAGTPEIAYALQLFDEGGLITERTGVTVLPPNSTYPIFEGAMQTGNRVPTRTELTLGEATVWLPASVGREQFQLVERRFFDTSTGRPRLEAVVENTAFTEAQDVEFVVTIFDRERRPLTASETFVDYFAAESEERLVFTWPNPIATTIRSCEIPTDVMLAIDLSGSMNDDQADPPQPVTAVLEAATAFAGRLETEDQAGVVTFATEATVAESLTTNVAGVGQVISQLAISPEAETGFTNTGDAITAAATELQSTRSNANARKVLVILTDGLATAPEDDPEGYARAAAAAAKATGIELYSIGLGEQVNMQFVRDIASTPEQSYQALTRTQVEAIYEEITASLCESGPATMDIIPKTDANFPAW